MGLLCSLSIILDITNNYKTKNSLGQDRIGLVSAAFFKFPNEKNQNYTTNFKGNKTDHWKISDKSNTDQLKAITGFCFTVGILTIVGLYSNLM